MPITRQQWEPQQACYIGCRVFCEKSNLKIRNFFSSLEWKYLEILSTQLKITRRACFLFIYFSPSALFAHLQLLSASSQLEERAPCFGVSMAMEGAGGGLQGHSENTWSCASGRMGAWPSRAVVGLRSSRVVIGHFITASPSPAWHWHDKLSPDMGC